MLTNPELRDIVVTQIVQLMPYEPDSYKAGIVDGMIYLAKLAKPELRETILSAAKALYDRMSPTCADPGCDRPALYRVGESKRHNRIYEPYTESRELIRDIVHTSFSAVFDPKKSLHCWNHSMRLAQAKQKEIRQAEIDDHGFAGTIVYERDKPPERRSKTGSGVSVESVDGEPVSVSFYCAR
jgi:hypothetical protein